MDPILSIKNYILYLITECGLSVTLHPWEKEPHILLSDLLQFNIHDNSYCTCVKADEHGQEACILHQKKVFAATLEKGTSYSGVCYAGVFEYVYPLSDGKNIIGFISVGSYAAEGHETCVAAAAKKLGIPEQQLTKAYATLKKNRPSKEKVDVLLFPLIQMLELYCLRNANQEPGEQRLIDRIVRYIRQNYALALTEEMLCEEFHCSRSYLSHVFKETAGKPFREYLTEVRLHHAKHLLKISSLNVTEIAFSVGFNDSNYFSSVFKKHVHMSPLVYRKANKKRGE